MPFEGVVLAHPLYRLIESSCGEALEIVDIAGDKNRARAVRPGNVGEPANPFEPGILKHGLGRFIDEAEHLPDLPVRRV